MVTWFAPILVDIKRFKRTYNDKQLLFFRTIFIEAKTFLCNALPVLEECIREKKKKKWNESIVAIKSVAEDLFFSRLVQLKTEKTPNFKDFNKIKEMVEALLEFKYNF